MVMKFPYVADFTEVENEEYCTVDIITHANEKTHDRLMFAVGSSYC